MAPIHPLGIEWQPPAPRPRAPALSLAAAASVVTLNDSPTPRCPPRSLSLAAGASAGLRDHLAGRGDVALQHPGQPRR